MIVFVTRVGAFTLLLNLAYPTLLKHTMCFEP